MKSPLEVAMEAKVIDIKCIIETKLHISIDSQILLYCNCLLEDEKTLTHYRIKNQHIITLVTRENIKKNDQPNVDCPQEDDINSLLNLHLNGDGIEPSNQMMEEIDMDEIFFGTTRNNNLTRTDKHRGICLIISNEKFTRLRPRPGNGFDEGNIKSTFQSLNYYVEVHRDVTTSKMKWIIDEVKKQIKPTYKMFIMFILSHGCEDSVIFTDDLKLSFDEISCPFTNKNWQIFIGKAKLFFFVCCQGEKLNAGVDIVHSHQVVEEIDYDCVNANRKKYPEMANFFFGYATCKSYVSGRKPSEGTVYVKSLCDVIGENRKWSVSDIHQEVQRRVSQQPIANDESVYQMPYCTNMLTEHAYFVDDHDN